VVQPDRGEQSRRRPPTKRQRERHRVLMALLETLTMRLRPGSWCVHGSTALSLHLPDFSREPADLDIYVDSVQLFDALSGFTADVATWSITVVNDRETPFRSDRVVPPTRSFLVEAMDADTGTIIDRVTIEAQADQRRFEFPDLIRPVHLSFSATVPHGVEAQRLSVLLADKFHAYSRSRGKRLNMRWVDLFDTAFIATHSSFSVSSEELSTARDAVLGINTSLMLATPPDPPVEWAASWGKYRFMEMYDGPDPRLALALFAMMWDLPKTPSTWSSRERCWRPCT
jgi:hypothetical protein